MYRWVEHFDEESVLITKENSTVVERNQEDMTMMTPEKKTSLIQAWVTYNQSIQSAHLSPGANELLFNMSQARVPHTKPSRDMVFLKMASEIATLSPDAETQVGAIIVNEHNHP